MEGIDILGYVAAALTTSAFIPQVVKTWKSKSTEDISLVMFVMFNIGIVLWLIYGIILEALPIILANLITGALALIILSFKVKDVLRKNQDES